MPSVAVLFENIHNGGGLLVEMDIASGEGA